MAAALLAAVAAPMQVFAKCRNQGAATPVRIRKLVKTWLVTCSLASENYYSKQPYRSSKAPRSGRGANPQVCEFVADISSMQLPSVAAHLCMHIFRIRHHATGSGDGTYITGPNRPSNARQWRVQDLFFVACALQAPVRRVGASTSGTRTSLPRLNPSDFSKPETLWLLRLYTKFFLA